MRIFGYLLAFICVFTVAPILAIGIKRKEIPTESIAKIRRIANETGRTINMELINADQDWTAFAQILPGDHLINKNITLSADVDAEYDLAQFDTAPEGQEPVERLFVRIARIVTMHGYRKEVRASFTLGILDQPIEPELEPEPDRVFQTLAMAFEIFDYEFDNYLIDVTLSGQDLTASHMEVSRYITPE